MSNRPNFIEEQSQEWAESLRAFVPAKETEMLRTAFVAGSVSILAMIEKGAQELEPQDFLTLVAAMNQEAAELMKKAKAQSEANITPGIREVVKDAIDKAKGAP